MLERRKRVGKAERTSQPTRALLRPGRTSFAAPLRKRPRA
jgi:hypothetical protein